MQRPVRRPGDVDPWWLPVLTSVRCCRPPPGRCWENVRSEHAGGESMHWRTHIDTPGRWKWRALLLWRGRKKGKINLLVKKKSKKKKLHLLAKITQNHINRCHFYNGSTFRRFNVGQMQTSKAFLTLYNPVYISNKTCWVDGKMSIIMTTWKWNIRKKRLQANLLIYRKQSKTGKTTNTCENMVGTVQGYI